MPPPRYAVWPAALMWCPFMRSLRAMVLASHTRIQRTTLFGETCSPAAWMASHVSDRHWTILAIITFRDAR
eukprot:4329323-Pyramimonas_sp.AAC.1